MAKHQTRRSISIKGLTYQRLQKYCEAHDKTMSGYLEEILAEKLDQLGVPEETLLRPRPIPEKKPEDFVGSHFTF